MSGIITRKNGDPFATRSNARGELTRLALQETHEVISLGGGYALARINRDEEQVTLKPGDYVSTEGMTEEQYHAVARAFIGAGARHADWENQTPLAFFGWTKDEVHNGLLLQSARGAANEFSRLLTIDQVLGATNAGNATPQPEEATMTTDPITALKQARTTRDEAEQAYQKALEEAREYLGEGFALTEVGSDAPLVDGENMDDPANWREGDVVECTYSGYHGYRQGGLYKVFSPLYGTRIGVIGDVEDQQEMRRAENFRFHHRPS